MSNIKTWQERPEKTYRGNFFTQVSDEERRDAEVKELRELLEELETELAEAKKDQARYQYIRKLNVPQFHKIFMLNLFSNIRFDEAIDAAIASTQEGK